MFEYDHKKVMAVFAKITARIVNGGTSESSQVDESEQDPTLASPHGGPTTSGTCRRQAPPSSAAAAWSRVPTAPSGDYFSPGPSSSVFGAIRRATRGSRVAPRPAGRGPGPEVAKTRPDGGAANKPTRAGRRKWPVPCPWSARSKKDLAVVDTSQPLPGSGRKSGTPPSRGGRRHPGMPAAKAEADLASMEVASSDESPLPPNVRRSLLVRLLGLLFPGCVGKSSRPFQSRGGRVGPTGGSCSAAGRSDGDDEDVGDGADAGSGGAGESVTGGSARDEPAATFWVGSQDDSGDSGMGQVLSSSHGAPDNARSHRRSHTKVKSVANKQTCVTVEDLQKTACELQQETNYYKHGCKLASRDLSSDDEIVDAEEEEEEEDEEDQDAAILKPTLHEKDLRPVCKEPGRPLYLGRGQSGVVRLMRLRGPAAAGQSVPRRLVAVKRLLGSSAWTTRLALARELRALASVQHCPVFPQLVGVLDGRSFAQEFIGNPKSLLTLSVTKALLGRPAVARPDWMRVVRDVAAGLAALHAGGWAHCDLQTNNVLLWRDRNAGPEVRDRWRARIIDLGNARPLTGPYAVCLDLSAEEKAVYYRSSRHIAPEVVEGLAPYGEASDVFGLGVLAQDIATVFIEAGGFGRLGDACASDQPQARPSLPALIDELDSLCSHHPEDREEDEHPGYRIPPEEKSNIITYV